MGGIGWCYVGPVWFVTHGKIVAIDVMADPERLSRLDGVAG